MTSFRAQQKLSDDKSRAVARDARFLGRGADVVRSSSRSSRTCMGKWSQREEKISLDRNTRPERALVSATPSRAESRPWSSTSLEVTAAAAMSNGETRALLPKAGGARAPLPRASDVGVTADASAEKMPRSRWHVTAAGLLASCAAALVVLICALAGTSGRASDAVSVRARLGTEADDFFHTQFHGENVAFSSDASAGLGLKTHRRGAEAEEDAEKDVERVARNPPKGKKAPEKEVEPVAKKPSREVDETPRDEGKAASNATVASKASKTSKTRSETKALDDRVELSGAVDKKHADPPGASSAKTRSRKPRILVAVISWHDGAEEVAAMERTWLGALKDADEHMDADYRVFVGEYDDANLGGRHAELRTREHKERRGFGGDELAAALGTRGGSSPFGGDERGVKTEATKTSSKTSSSSLGKRRARASESETAPKQTKTFDSDAEMDELAEDLAEAVDAFEEERTGAAPTREWAIRRESDDASDDASNDASDDSSLGDTKMSKHEFTSRLAEAVSKAKTQAKAQETLQAKAAKKAAKQTDLKAKPRKEKATTSDAKATKTTKAAESTREATREAKTSKTLDSKSAKSAVETRVELPVGDAYEDLPAKVLAAIQYAAEHDYDYVYKVDTDVFVLPEIFLKFVKTQVVDKNIDWMGSENKMYPAYLDPSIDFTDPANAAIVKANSSPSGFKCGLARDWHFGKCTDAALNKQRYAGVNPVSVDGGHGYILSKAAAWAVSDFAFKRSDDLQRHRRIDIYEDQLVSHILVKQGFLPVDYSGVAPYKVSGMTKEMADDSCALADDPGLGAAVGDRLRAMRDYRFESGANLYETAAGWNPGTMDARMLPTSLMRVGIQPYVWSDSMVMKWEYYRDRETIERQRDDGTYEPRSLPIGFELDPDLSNDPFAVPEFPEFSEEDAAKSKTSSSSKRTKKGSENEKGSENDAKLAKRSDANDDGDSDAGKATRASKPADQAREMETFKRSLDDFHVFDETNRRSGGSDAAASATDDDDDADDKEADDESTSSRPGAWITVEELSDDPFAEPEWEGDDDELVRAQVQEMLRAKREARGDDGVDDDDAAAAADKEQRRRFEAEEAKKRKEAEEDEESQSTATVTADDSYDGVAEDR